MARPNIIENKKCFFARLESLPGVALVQVKHQYVRIFGKDGRTMQINCKRVFTTQEIENSHIVPKRFNRETALQKMKIGKNRYRYDCYNQTDILKLAMDYFSSVGGASVTDDMEEIINFKYDVFEDIPSLG